MPTIDTVDHVVVERGRVAERWRSERWDSLRLLTPNWMSRLPGWSYTGPDPHGYMTAAEVVDHFQGYAAASTAPVMEDSAVVHLGRRHDGFDVLTTSHDWRAAHVVVATGWCDQPAVPALAAQLDPSIVQVTPSAYRNPGSLPDGGVLVVGASATGVQLADELSYDGRSVVLAVGSHTRLPRHYWGMDIFWWLERLGTLDRTIDEVPDPVAARHEPAPALRRPAGRPADRRRRPPRALRRRPEVHRRRGGQPDAPRPERDRRPHRRHRPHRRGPRPRPAPDLHRRSRDRRPR
jgi:putative flavoprotein involved in K+ transport